MGDTLIVFKIMPEESGQENLILDEIKKLGFDLKDSKLEPIAFGLNAIKVAFVIKGNKSPQELENALNKLPNVMDVTVDKLTLL